MAFADSVAIHVATTTNANAETDAAATDGRSRSDSGFAWRLADSWTARIIAIPRPTGLDAIQPARSTFPVRATANAVAIGPMPAMRESEAAAATERDLQARVFPRDPGQYRIHHLEQATMPVIMRETIVAAGAVNDNLLAGSAFEFARQNSLVSIGVNQSATGGFATIQSGADVVAEEFAPPIATVYPIIPDGMYFSDVAAAGDRLVLRYRNPTGGALTVRVVCQVTPL